MNTRKSRSWALITAASLAFGLTACAGGSPEAGKTEPQKTLESTEQAPPQTTEEACDILLLELSPAIAKMRADSVAPQAGQLPDFAGIFGMLDDAAKKADESITNASVSQPLADVIDVAGRIRTTLEGIDYSSIDPNAPDAIKQAQALNDKSLKDAGLGWEDFQTATEAVTEVCPMPEPEQ